MTYDDTNYDETGVLGKVMSLRAIKDPVRVLCSQIQPLRSWIITMGRKFQ